MPTVTSLSVPSVFSGFSGNLDATSSGTAQINVPNNPALSGSKFFAGFIELSGGAPMRVESISNDLSITIN